MDDQYLKDSPVERPPEHERAPARPAVARSETRRINLALQGGGTHGAFTWGALERLLEDERLEFDGVSGTSAGAMNAAMFVQGLAEGGRAGAISLLERFWRQIAGGHALSPLGEADYRHVTGPDRPLPDHGVISIVGPGTGLGVAHVLRTADGAHVTETEGGHIDFAPLDAIEDAILATLRQSLRRVSVERVVAGPGLSAIYHALAALEGRSVVSLDDAALWRLALAGEDSLAVAALDRFCLSLGAIVGDIALAQGAKAVVLAGGVGLRIADHLPRSGFAQRFCAKGRFEGLMADMPVKLITHPQPGLFGAAAAFAQRPGFRDAVALRRLDDAGTLGLGVRTTRGEQE